MARNKPPKRQPLSPRVRYQAVSREWDWSDSTWAESLLTYGHVSQAAAEEQRDLSRRIGCNQERIVRITTTVEIVDEGEDAEINPYGFFHQDQWEQERQLAARRAARGLNPAGTLAHDAEQEAQ